MYAIDQYRGQTVYRIVPPDVAAAAAAVVPVPEAQQALYDALEEALDDFLAAVSANASQSAASDKGASLLSANGNRGTNLLAPLTLTPVLIFLDLFEDMGVELVTLDINFPLLANGYHTAYSATAGTKAAYLAFYHTVVDAIRERGMKVAIASQTILGGSWSSLPSLTDYYAALTYNQYKAGRAEVIQTIITEFAPDFVVLFSERDTEVSASGRTELNTAATYITFGNELLAAAQAVATAATSVGAGVSAWDPDRIAFVTSFAANANTDFIGLHAYPVADDGGANYLLNALALVELAHFFDKPVCFDEFGLLKDTALSGVFAASQEIFALDAYAHWAPLDQKMILAVYRLMGLYNDGPRYMSKFWTNDLTAYLDYETASLLTAAQRQQAHNQAAYAAARLGNLTTTGAYYRDLA